MQSGSLRTFNLSCRYLGWCQEGLTVCTGDPRNGASDRENEFVVGVEASTLVLKRPGFRGERLCLGMNRSSIRIHS